MARELERKWLISEEEWNRICFPENWQNATIIQSYLPTNIEGEQLRVRAQLKEGNWKFTMTRKSGTNVHDREEVQQKLSAEMYESLKSISMHSLQKEKATRKWGAYKYELNKIIDPVTSDLVCCLLEVEFKTLEDLHAFEIDTDMINVISEVTDNPHFQLVNMSELVSQDKWNELYK